MERGFDARDISIGYAQSRIDNLKSKLNRTKQEILNLRACCSNLTGQKFICMCFECGKAFDTIKCLENHNCLTIDFNKLNCQDGQ